MRSASMRSEFVSECECVCVSSECMSSECVSM